MNELSCASKIIYTHLLIHIYLYISSDKIYYQIAREKHTEYLLVNDTFTLDFRHLHESHSQ